MVEHCISAFNRIQEIRNFEYYVTDTLYIMVRATTTSQIKRYYDIVNPEPEDNRTAAEIAGDVIARHGLKVVS